jgi:hypothetical protein
MVRRVGVLFVLGLALVGSGCKEVGSVLGPDVFGTDTDWIVRTTTRFFLKFRPGSAAERDLPILEAEFEDSFARTVGYLDVRYNNKITALIYSSIADKERNTPVGGTTTFTMPSLEVIVCVYNPPGEVLSIGPHEIVHAIVYWTVGMMSSDMLAEGIAVAVTGSYGGPQPVHAAAATLLRQGRLKPLEAMFDNRIWAGVINEDPFLYYNQAGSFVKYLVESRGIGPFKRFYTRASAGEFRTSFPALFGLSVEEFYREWLKFLEGSAP